MAVFFWVWYPWGKVKSQLETRPWRLQPGLLSGSWVLPRADPEERSWVQWFVWEMEWGRRERETGKKKDPITVVITSRWLLWATEVQSCWVSCERRCRLHPRFIPWLGREIQCYPPTLVLYCLRAVPEVSTPWHFLCAGNLWSWPSHVGGGANGICCTKEMLLQRLKKIGSLYNTL